MSAWDLTRRGSLAGAANKPSTLSQQRPKLVGMEQLMPSNQIGTAQQQNQQQHQPMSYWHEQLLALIESATGTGAPQVPLNLDGSNLVQNLPLFLLADKQQSPLAQVDPLHFLEQQHHHQQHQSLIDSLASYCSRSLTPSPSTTSSSHTSNSPGSACLECGPVRAKGPKHLSLLIEASAPTADSTFCSSLSSYSSGGSTCGDLLQPTNESVLASGAGGLQAPDRKARKKDQNRRAAFNYRRKKMEERDKMLEEEAKLVHRHVRLAGKIARLEAKIIAMLSSQTRRVLDSTGKPIGHLCRACSKLCDTVAALRTHLKTRHFPETMPQLMERTGAVARAAAKSKSHAHARLDRAIEKASSKQQAGCTPARTNNTDLQTNTPLDPDTHRDKSVDAYCDLPDHVDDNEDDDDADCDDDMDDCDNNNDDCNL